MISEISSHVYSYSQLEKTNESTFFEDNKALLLDTICPGLEEDPFARCASCWYYKQISRYVLIVGHEIVLGSRRSRALRRAFRCEFIQEI